MKHNAHPKAAVSLGESPVRNRQGLLGVDHAKRTKKGIGGSFLIRTLNDSDGAVSRSIPEENIALK